MKSQTRNFGIDMLRILSMLGVVVLHVLGHGGLLTLKHTVTSFSIVWFFEILAYPAVICFVLISGYVGYKENNVFPKIKNIISLILTVGFYSVSIFLVFTFLGFVPFELKELVKSFFPTILKSYWFFSTYFGLFLLSPMLNLLVQKLNLKQAFVFFSVFLFFSIISTIYDTFSLQGGYGLIWFAFIYLIGAIIKKFNLDKLFSKKWWLIIALLLFVITWISKIVMQFSNISLLVNQSNLLVRYVSPTIVLMAIALLCFFSKVKCSSLFTQIIPIFSSSAFSVYLIHDNSYIREYLISKIYTVVGNSDLILLTLFIIFTALAIFVTCILIDKIRIVIFKLVKVEKISVQIEKIIRKTVTKTYLQLEKIVQKTAE